MGKSKGKAIIYARQSSGSEEYSESIEQQFENCRNFAAKEGIEIVHVFKDLNQSGETYPAGTAKLAFMDRAYVAWLKEQSGPRPFRKGLADVLNHFADPEIGILIVNEITRLYRPVTGSYLDDYINRLICENNIKLMQVMGEAIDLTRLDHTLLMTIKNQILFDDLQKKRKNSIAALRAKLDHGYNSNACKIFGLDYAGKDAVKINPEEAGIIRFIYAEALKHKPTLQIIKACNRKFGQNRFFYETNIRNALAQPLYCGYQYNNKHELIKSNQLIGDPIVSFRVWSKIQEIIEERKSRPALHPRYHWLPLSGRLYCGVCGARLTCITGAGIVYYNCHKSYLSHAHDVCRKSRIRFRGRLNMCSENYECGLYETLMPFLILGVFAIFRREREIQRSYWKRKKYRQNYDELEEHENVILKLYTDQQITKEQLERQFEALRPRKEKLNLKLIQAAAVKGEKPVRLMDYWMLVRKIQDMILPDHDYDELLIAAKLTVTVNERDIVVHTCEGDMSLPRIYYKNRSYLPEWTLEIGDEQMFFSKNTTFKVTYRTGTPSDMGYLANLHFLSE